MCGWFSEGLSEMTVINSFTLEPVDWSHQSQLFIICVVEIPRSRCFSTRHVQQINNQHWEGLFKM